MLLEPKSNKTLYTFKLFDKISDCSSLWDNIPAPSILLTSAYLETLEAYKPETMKFRYVLVFQSEQLIACFYFQILPFNAADRLQLEVAPRSSFFSCFYRQIKKTVASKVDFVSIINGNLLATGPYGFKLNFPFDENRMQDLLDQLLKELFRQNDKIENASLVLIKELPISKSFDIIADKPLYYMHPFLIQPTMILNVLPSWLNLDDYFEDLQSKYRLRVKKAIHAAKDLVHIELDFEKTEMYQDKIYELYFNTADGSDFNLVKLHQQYFTKIKKALGNKYRIFGFFVDGELIAFYSFMDDGSELLGHFLGTMKENNIKYQVYFNILLKFIEHGIRGKYSTINLARTAIEIKSSVGAIPVDMVCYLTHRNKIINKIVPKLLNYLKPESSFTIRNPFKKG